MTSRESYQSVKLHWQDLRLLKQEETSSWKVGIHRHVEGVSCKGFRLYPEHKREVLKCILEGVTSIKKSTSSISNDDLHSVLYIFLLSLPYPITDTFLTQ